MQLIITDAWLAKSRSFQLSGPRLALAVGSFSIIVMLFSAGLYHWVFLKGARDGWPMVGGLVKFAVKDEVAQRDRYMRENLGVMAKKLGEMQAKMLQLESLGERVSGLAGMNPAEMKMPVGQGGRLVLERDLSMDELRASLQGFDRLTDQKTELMTSMESRLVARKIERMMVPTQAPVANGFLGSVFGWRIDPITGHSALHTGLDFPAVAGTPIYAAAGGIVVAQEFHPEYGNMIEVDHGNDLITRYGHGSKVNVKKGDLIKRGQHIADVGSTGRSTGAHLHFEVLVQGVPHDPQKFLNAGKGVATVRVAQNATPTSASKPPSIALTGVPSRAQ